AMAYTLFFRGLQGVTARMDLRFRLPAHAHDQLEVEAWTVKENRRITDIEARISRDGIVLVESTARFMKLGEIRPETLTGKAPLEERVR
ncbi:MAG TPA: hotdog fold domain-containing protein, partial [Chloroflexota bacterium]